MFGQAFQINTTSTKRKKRRCLIKEPMPHVEDYKNPKDTKMHICPVTGRKHMNDNDRGVLTCPNCGLHLGVENCMEWMPATKPMYPTSYDRSKYLSKRIAKLRCVPEILKNTEFLLSLDKLPNPCTWAEVYTHFKSLGEQTLWENFPALCSAVPSDYDRVKDRVNGKHSIVTDYQGNIMRSRSSETDVDIAKEFDKVTPLPNWKGTSKINFWYFLYKVRQMRGKSTNWIPLKFSEAQFVRTDKKFKQMLRLPQFKKYEHLYLTSRVNHFNWKRAMIDWKYPEDIGEGPLTQCELSFTVRGEDDKKYEHESLSSFFGITPDTSSIPTTEKGNLQQ